MLLVLVGFWGSLLPMITPTLLGGLGVGFEQRAACTLFYYLNTTWAWRFSYYPRWWACAYRGVAGIRDARGAWCAGRGGLSSA